MKRTNLDGMLNGQTMSFLRPCDMSEAEVEAFINFVKGMLEIDPTLR